MEFIKLNNNWNAEPNSPDVHIVVSNSDISVSFYLNAFMHSEFQEEDMGLLVFHNCLQYRYGTPNDEGFYAFGQSRYKQYDIAWGEFYLIQKSDWQENFPNLIRVSEQPSTSMNHYLFYFRDGTFECIASNYDFILNTSSDFGKVL